MWSLCVALHSRLRLGRLFFLYHANTPSMPLTWLRKNVIISAKLRYQNIVAKQSNHVRLHNYLNLDWILPCHSGVDLICPWRSGDLFITALVFDIFLSSSLRHCVAICTFLLFTSVLYLVVTSTRWCLVPREHYLILIRTFRSRFYFSGVRWLCTSNCRHTAGIVIRCFSRRWRRSCDVSWIESSCMWKFEGYKCTYRLGAIARAILRVDTRHPKQCHLV